MAIWRTGMREDSSFGRTRSSLAREPQIEAETQHDGNVTDIQVGTERETCVQSCRYSRTILELYPAARGRGSQ